MGQPGRQTILTNY